jgi:hypothetical protein
VGARVLLLPALPALLLLAAYGHCLVDGLLPVGHCLRAAKCWSRATCMFCMATFLTCGLHPQLQPPSPAALLTPSPFVRGLQSTAQ